MKRSILALACIGAMALATTAQAGPVSGALIGAGGGAVVAGPPGAVAGAVIGAVLGGPNLHPHHHHRVYAEGSRHGYRGHRYRRDY